jgi:hypothetical protein
MLASVAGAARVSHAGSAKRGESPDYALAVARGNANHLEWETATVRVSREKKGDCLPEAVLEANDRLVAERYVWSTNGAEALYEGWHRPRGGTWLQTVSFRPGQPSVQWTASRNAFATDETMDKFGAYRGANSQPTPIWHDNICVAETGAAAESCF